MLACCLLIVIGSTHAFDWNFFSSTQPDLEHGQDFSNFFHDVVQEHQHELKEIEEQQEEHAAIVEEETRNLTSLMIKLQKMFDQAEEEEKELEADENKTKEKEELHELMESAVVELQADIKKIEHDLSCSFEDDEVVDDETEIEPIYKTRPNKYLIPTLTWGPNNQLRGFREAVIMAIQLNRTLCIPPFYKHHTDKSNASLVRFLFSFTTTSTM